MALPVVGDEFYPTPVEIRNQILADIRYAYAKAGLNVNVKPGSDHFIRADAFGRRLSIAIANNKASLADLNPLTATGQALEDLAGVYGVAKRAAASGAGFITITCTGTVTIPIDFECTAPNGFTYKTITANTVVTGDTVEVIAVDAGEGTNQDFGTILTWNSAAIGALAQTATVASGGIDGGADADDDEKLRSRLILRLAFPGVGGNFSQVIQFAEDSTAAVELAFVYDAVRGPASYDVCVTAEGGDRTLSPQIVNNVSGYILGEMPGSNDLNATSVLKEEVDVVLNAKLPLPINAAGSGGGWRDAAPWPTTADSAAGPGIPVSITAVAGNVITVNATSSDPPTIGKHIGIWNPSTQQMVEFSIMGVGGVSGAYTVTLDSTNGASFVTAGMYVSAGATNLKTYATDFLAQMNSLGPGEKTDNPDILPRARRQPPPDVQSPPSLTNILLNGVTSQHSEVLNLEYGARYATGTTTDLIEPSLPATTADPPRILVLKHFAIRKI